MHLCDALVWVGMRLERSLICVVLTLVRDEFLSTALWAQTAQRASGSNGQGAPGQQLRSFLSLMLQLCYHPEIQIGGDADWPGH